MSTRREVELPTLPQIRDRVRLRYEHGDDGPAHVVVAALLLDGRLDIALFEEAARGLVVRHEALRTMFPPSEGFGRQYVRDDSDVVVLCDELNLDPDEQYVVRNAEEAQSRPFLVRELEQGTLVRFRVLQGPTRSAVILAIDHLIVDEVALLVLLEELAALYRGDASACPDPPSYVQYVVQEAAFVESAGAAELLDLYAASVGAVGPLPAASGRLVRKDRGPAPEFSRISWSLGETRSRALRSQSLGGSRFMTLLGALILLLRNLGWESPIGLLCVYANRDGPWTRLVLSLATWVPLQLESKDEWSFEEQLHHVREAVLTGLAFTRCDHWQLIRHMRPDWAGSWPSDPFLSVNYAQQTPMSYDWGTLRAEVLHVPPPGFDWLTVRITEDVDDVFGDIGIDAAIVSECAAHWLASQLGDVVELIAAEGHRSIGELRERLPILPGD